MTVWRLFIEPFIEDRQRFETSINWLESPCWALISKAVDETTVAPSLVEKIIMLRQTNFQLNEKDEEKGVCCWDRKGLRNSHRLRERKRERFIQRKRKRERDSERGVGSY